MNITKVEFKSIIDLSLRSWRKSNLQENWQVSFACEYEVSWILCFIQIEAIQRLRVQWLLIYWIILLILTTASVHEALIQQIERLRITTGRMWIALILSSQFVKVHERNSLLIEMENWTISRLDLITSWSSNMKLVKWLSLDSLEEVVDEYGLARNGGTVQTYTNASSQKCILKESKIRVKFQKSTLQILQNQYWNQYITENKNPKKEKMSIVWIQNIRSENNIDARDTITILNAPIEISDKTINKITYKSDECRLEIDKTDTLWSVIE